MNEKKYEKRLNFQSQLIERQSKQIDDLKKKNEKLENECRKKDEIINSVDSLREALTKEISEVKKRKEEFNRLISELKDMKKIVNQEVYRGRWKIIRWIMKL